MGTVSSKGKWLKARAVMKHLFLVISLALLLFSACVYWSYPDARSDVPAIRWTTDRNPARVKQVESFHRWLASHHLTKDDKPIVQLWLDTANGDPTKQLIQGISGVGGDIVDMNGTMHYFQSVGMLSDLTDWGKELGFDLSHTWAAIEPDITVDKHQYAFPCNVVVEMLWVNKATFRQYGITPPSGEWSFDEFEQTGKRLVNAANPPGQPRLVFFVNNVDLRSMHRSLGLSRYNETMTHSTLNDERFEQVLALKYKWMHEDHLLPTLADQSSFDTLAGYGGASLQLFNRGQYAMFPMGRYALIQLRQFGNLDLGVVEPPNGGLPNTLMRTRCAGLYVAGTDPKLARYFLAYLASEEYNLQIVDDADALPPNPIFTQNEAYKHPPAHPNEWGVHEVFAQAAQTIAVTASTSPFVLNSVADRILKDSEDACMSGRLTPREAAQQAYDRLEAEIARSLREQPELRERYNQRTADQAEIDRLRRENKPVPVALISNPFHIYYYRARGWLEE